MATGQESVMKRVQDCGTQAQFTKRPAIWPPDLAKCRCNRPRVDNRAGADKGGGADKGQVQQEAVCEIGSGLLGLSSPQIQPAGPGLERIPTLVPQCRSKRPGPDGRGFGDAAGTKLFSFPIEKGG
jgi:hypothetical protein